MIPLVDLRAQLANLRPEIDRAIGNVLDNTAFILGPAVEKFEREFADYIGVAHCVAVNSGTAALQLALMGAGIGAGDEVITTPASFFATAEAISLTGARPVFVDCDAETLTIDVGQIAAAITPRTRAIVPVHLYGQAADMEPLTKIAVQHDLKIIEDACQAHGATYRGKRLGGLGLAGAFSFYPGKNLGAIGEGGAITTNDANLVQVAKQLREHGSPEKYRHNLVGYNYRMEGVQGAVLSVKLPYLNQWNQKRAQLAAHYSERLAGLRNLKLPVVRDSGISAWHLYTVRSPQREQIFAAFARQGIACAVHYPIPIHLQPAYQNLAYPVGSMPVAEAASNELLSLPLYPELTSEQQEQVISTLVSVLK